MNFKARSEKRLQTEAAQKRLWASQTITVDEDWRIIRLDQLNWQIQQFTKTEAHPDGEWQERGFYGKLPEALQALSGKMLGERAQSSLQDTLELLKDIKRSILMALAKFSDASPADGKVA